MAIKIINPANQSVVAEYQYHSLPDALEKIKQFKVFQVQWKSRPIEERAEAVQKIAAELKSQKETLAKQAVIEMGKPLKQAIGEVEKCALALETLSRLAVENLKEKVVEAHYKKTVIRPEPYGIVFSIQPWNFPYWQAFRMAACAWMAGNLVVLKHSDEVAGCAELIEKVSEVDGHKMLLNLRLTHADAAEIIKSAHVQAVTFTGSTSGGKSVAQAAGGALKKCVLELGGSDAYIVMPDCDMELAAKTCAQARLINSGQSCIAGKRFFVHDSIFVEFKKKFKEQLQTYKVGDPMNLETQVGPLAAQRFVQNLQEQVKRANFGGAKLEWIAGDIPKTGSFAQIGLLDFGSNLKVFENEEIFGPVASLYRFDDIGEVVDVINNGPFGLGSGVFTNDLNFAERLAREIQVGTFTINSFVQSDPRVPFGGMRESGFAREMGLEGLHDFVAWKVVGQA